jgi:DNA-binding transcriptional ArsR family regulator
MQALSDPHRLEIVRRLAEDDAPRACGSFGFDIAKSTMTHHFRVLREAGLIRQERQGTTKLTALRRRPKWTLKVPPGAHSVWRE